VSYCVLHKPLQVSLAVLAHFNDAPREHFTRRCRMRLKEQIVNE